MGIRQENSLDVENRRLRALNSYDVLDTLPEKEYDAITRLASYICQAPIALITLIDNDKQWFKSKIGLDISETPRNQAFCNYTIQGDQIFEVPDALLNKELKSNPFVDTTDGIRFYAGAPLIDPDGYRLGALCVIDLMPRKLTNEQRDALRTLADEVMSHLTLRKQKKELEKSLDIHKEFSNLFNSSSEIHFIAGADSNIETINDAVLTILGYTPEQAIGRSLWDFVVGKNRELYVPLIEEAIRSQKPFDLETKTVTRTGEVKHMSWTAVNKAGKWFASGRDTTYQQNLIDETRQLSLVASKIRNGVVISNVNDEVVWINDAFETITGYNLQDVEGQFLGTILKGKPKDAEAEKILVEAIKNNLPYEVELSMVSKDGRPLWILVTNSIIYAADGSLEKYIRIITNITARKQAEHDVEILSFAARKSPSGIMIRDAKGRIIWMNEAMEHIIGYSFEDLKDQTVGNKLVGEETRPCRF
jgi:PAS domain S-box-containing protein